MYPPLDSLPFFEQTAIHTIFQFDELTSTNDWAKMHIRAIDRLVQQCTVQEIESKLALQHPEIQTASVERPQNSNEPVSISNEASPFLFDSNRQTNASLPQKGTETLLKGPSRPSNPSILQSSTNRSFDFSDEQDFLLRGQNIFSGNSSSTLPFLVVAKRQTAGRGQRSNRWWTGDQSLAFSWGTTWQAFGLNRNQSAVLSLKIAEIVRGTIEKTLLAQGIACVVPQNGENELMPQPPCQPGAKNLKNSKTSPFSAILATTPSNFATDSVGLETPHSLFFDESAAFFVRVKKPNDVYINDRKVAGILIESPTPRTLVIGIGVNLNNETRLAPPELQSRIISLKDLCGKSISKERFLLDLVCQLS